MYPKILFLSRYHFGIPGLIQIEETDHPEDIIHLFAIPINRNITDKSSKNL